MLEDNPDAPKFMDRHDVRFRDLLHTCDSVYRELHSEGEGAHVKHTPFFSVEDEATLWELRNLAHRFAQTLEFIADISLALDCAMVQDPLYPSGKGALS